jgi:hypothetical protein
MDAPTIVLATFLAVFDVGFLIILLVGWLRR